MGSKRTKRWKASSKDRISELPDDILSTILSLLPLRESIRTCTFSRRWKYLWKTYAQFSPNINLDVMTMRANNYFNLKFHGSSGDGGKITLWRERRNFVRWVERMMQVNYNNDRARDSFSLCFYLSKDFAENIDRWISTAIAKGVQKFTIDLSTSGPRSFRHSEDRYTFPSWLFTQETSLSINCLSLKTLELGPIDFKCFRNLAEVRLEEIRIDLESIQKILSDCPNLEKLSLVKVKRLRAPIFEFSGPTLKLKHLRLDDCSISGEVNIDAVNLAKLEYVGNPVILTFRTFPGKLSDVTIDFLREPSPASLNYALGLLSKDIPNMESLFLTVAARPKDMTIRRHFKALYANLKTLVLKVVRPQEVLWGYVPLLQASPYLHRLELHLMESSLKTEPMPGRFVDTHHDHLKEILLTGFNGTAHEIEFAKYLLINCNALKKMTIDSEFKDYDHNSGSFYSGPNSTGEEAAKKKREIEMRTRRQLKKVITSGLQLQFV